MSAGRWSLVVPLMERHGGLVSELTFDFCVTRSGTTRMAISGGVEAHRCGLLRDGVDMATALRAKGPVVLDLAGVERLPGAALLILWGAAEQAARHGRRFSVRNLRREVMSDARGQRLHQVLWPDLDTDKSGYRRGQEAAQGPSTGSRRSSRTAGRGSNRSSALPAAFARALSSATSSSVARRGRNQ